MQHESNPFQELYVSDDPDPTAYVRLFSDVPVRNAQILFRPGNVVVKGLQGSGKSMLLNLFRPKIRVAYHRENETFPVPEGLSRYIGAGINLRRSGALDIGQLPLVAEGNDDEALYPLYFADFLNYYIVKDILASLCIVRDHADVFSNIVNGAHLDAFAAAFGADDCWFGALDGCENFASLCDGINERVMAYRKLHQRNSSLPSSVHRTKTEIGEPIAKAADYLKQSGAVGDDVSFFIRIDEVDRLLHEDIIDSQLGLDYRRIINKALGKRDQRVSYRIGTRPYGWGDDLQCFGTGSRLEDLRDYRMFDIDRTVRRLENRKTWSFPEFAKDVLRRRLDVAGYKTKGSKNFVRKLYGPRQDACAAAKRYAGNSSADRILHMDENWSQSWRELLLPLFQENPLEAMLASAWAHQGVKKGTPSKRLAAEPPEERPWERPYWRKEHVRQCLLQIAARTGQRLEWSGGDSIIALCGGNITVFLSVCHEVWEAHLRHNRHKPESERTDPVTGPDPIAPSVQASGVHAASTDWYNKIAELPGGHDRQRFVKVLGNQFRVWLRDDPAMSYPGWSGFSIEEERIPKDKLDVLFLLRQAADYGSLYAHVHISRHKRGGIRTKWYLSPILSPYFQIPESHVKEPRYLGDVEQIEKWLHKADIPQFRNRGLSAEPKVSTDAAPDLVDLMDGKNE